MPSLAKLASMMRENAAQRRELPVRSAPSWLLLPGLIFLVAAVATLYQYRRYFPAGPLDLTVYLGGIEAFRNGEPIYQQGYGPIGLPFTYPPAALVLFYPLRLASPETTFHVLEAISFAATFLVAWCVTGMLRYRGTAGRIGAAAAFTGLSLWLEPIQTNSGFGQINAVLMALVVVDLALLRRTRFAGVGIGVAAAVKLVPAIFVLYLILSRRFRAAATAIGTFVALSVAGVAIVPHSAEFWLDAVFIRGDRVVGGMGPHTGANQSLRGFWARIFEETASRASTASVLFWGVSVIAVLVLGLFLAVRAERRGEDAAAMCLVALTALLISPVSWSHHWVWITAFLMVLTDVVMRQRGTVLTIAAGAPALVAAAFTVWPLRATRTSPFQANGIIWVAYRQGDLGTKVGEQLYIVAGLGMLGLAALWLRREPARVDVPRQVARDADAGPVTEMTGTEGTGRSRVDFSSTPIGTT
jgi:alpha-1,2-mannosyltransferase